MMIIPMMRCTAATRCCCASIDTHHKSHFHHHRHQSVHPISLTIKSDDEGEEEY